MEKKSFMLYLDTLEISEKLSDEQLGKFFRAIIAYQKGKDFELPFDLELVFSLFKTQFERDNKRYEERAKRSRNNGKNGGRPKEPSGLIDNPKNPVGYKEPRKPDSVSDSVSDSDSVIIKKHKEKDKSFPAFVEILNYFNKTTNSQLRETAKKKRQIQARLKVYNIDEIKEAIKTRTEIPFYKGENKDSKIWYNDWESLFRNDDKIESILNTKIRNYTDWTDDEWDNNYNNIKSDKKRWLKQNNNKLYQILEVKHF